MENERAIEDSLEKDKHIIQAVTQREILRARLEKNIASRRNARARITTESQLVVERENGKSKKIKGQRKTQNYFVTEEEIMNRVMHKLKMPKEAFKAAKEVRKEEAVEAKAEAGAGAGAGAEDAGTGVKQADASDEEYVYSDESTEEIEDDESAPSTLFFNCLERQPQSVPQEIQVVSNTIPADKPEQLRKAKNVKESKFDRLIRETQEYDQRQLRCNPNDSIDLNTFLKRKEKQRAKKQRANAKRKARK